MTAALEVDLEMGHLSRKSLEGATIDDYDFVYDGCYGRPPADASGPTAQGIAKPVDDEGEGVPVGHNYGDSSRKTRNLHLAKSNKDDDAVFKSRKGHIESILLFTGLFSATISLFVIESHTKLSHDPGEQTVALFNHVSQQLVGISRGAPLSLPPSPDSIPSPPAVRVSILWFLSLGLNITCAIWAILWQQWWQRYYIDPLGQSGEPQRRARVRASIISGTGHKRTMETIWMLLHTSVLSFFIGLVDSLLSINKTVAWIFLGYTVPLALVYIAATTLDKEALTRTLVGLTEDREVENFVAHTPGFFD